VKLNTSRLPGRAGAIVNFEMEDLPPVKLAAWLWDKHRVLVAGVEHPEFKGLRIVPALYTTEAELDRFVHLLFEARRTKNGLKHFLHPGAPDPRFLNHHPTSCCLNPCHSCVPVALPS
jgi:hypothetical protein